MQTSAKVEQFAPAVAMPRGVGAPAKRLLLLLHDRTEAGLPFPNVDEIALTKIVANRGAARNVYADIEKAGLVERAAHGWSSGAFTRLGRQVAAQVVQNRASVPARQTRGGFKLWESSVHGLRTVHPQSVRAIVRAENPFKDGRGIAKLGFEVTKGWLKGAHISYLTLEERATCPASCAMLAKCYGDSMVRAVRWKHGPDLVAAIEQQLLRWDRLQRRPRLIRLHELGDFYSVEYVEHWRQWLRRFPWLHVFGFTAWPDDHKIGRAIAAGREEFNRRFAIRRSNSTGAWASAVVAPGKSLPDGAFWCPEQDRKAANCGACGACWTSEKIVAFKEH